MIYVMGKEVAMLLAGAAAVGHIDDKMLAKMRQDFGDMCMCACSCYGCFVVGLLA